MGCGAQKKVTQMSHDPKEEVKVTSRHQQARAAGKISETTPDSSKSDALMFTSSSQSIKIDASLFVRKNTSNLYENYDICGKIGEGLSGYIRQATQKTTGEARAVKSIEKSSLSTNPALKFKFFKELEILKSIAHPNILKVYEYFEDNFYFHMVTELISGGQLFDYVLQTKMLTEAIAAGFMQQIFSGVSYCHENGIIHGDLQPENILLEAQSSNSVIKIIDFGTSTLIGSTLSDQSYSNALFTAPEILSSKQYNEKCDIWSCGVILYILLSGKPPFFGKEQKDIAQRAIIGDYTLKSAEWLKISSTAKDLVKRCLEYNPMNRISAKEALEHAWIRENSSLTKMPSLINFQTLKNLNTFRLSQKVQQAVVTFIASQTLCKDSERLMTENFRKIDRNGDGKISKDELLQVYLMTKNIKEATNEAAKIMDQFDTNNSGFIDYSEFITACLKQEDIVNENNLMRAFKMFDADSSGKINIQELSEVLNIGASESSAFKVLVQEIDKNQDGEIDFYEFKEMMLKSLAEN